MKNVDKNGKIVICSLPWKINEQNRKIRVIFILSRMFLIPECPKCLTNARRAWVRYFGHEWVKNMSDNMKIREFYYFVHKFFLVVHMQLYSILVDIMKCTRYFLAKIDPKTGQNWSKIGQNRSKIAFDQFFIILRSSRAFWVPTCLLLKKPDFPGEPVSGSQK